MHSFKATQHPIRDVRTTTTSRRSSATGYLARPCVDSRLDAPLPSFEIRAHRIVQIGSEAWEIWSPNSLQNPFLPGLIEDTLRAEVATKRSERRCDGHLGRFDPCVSPQYSAGYPAWAPHVRCCPHSSLDCPEFTDILDITDGSPASCYVVLSRYVDELLRRNEMLDARMTELRTISHSNPAVALEDEWRRHRPSVTQEDIRELRSISSFEKALDEVTQVQRDLKMKAAWLDWMECLQTTPSWSRTSNELPPMADDSYIGIWINSMHQEDIDWLLAHYIPCFVVHRLMEGELERLREAGFARKESTFTLGTPIEDRFHPYNRMDDFLRRQGAVIAHSDEDGSIRREEPSSPLSEMAASFSLAQRDWAKGNGIPRAYLAPPMTSLTPNPSSITSLDFSNYGAEPLDYVEVDPRRVAWIRPPPVIRAAENRKWEKWVEKNVDGQLFVVKVGRSHSNVESASYFDRFNHREVILLEEVRPLPGAVSRAEVFGLPCPRHLHFAETPQNKNPRPAKASSWLYLDRNPSHHDVGLKAALPDAESLPLKDGFRASGSNRPPSPPPSPGHPDPPHPAPFLSFDDSPDIRGFDDSTRPISPVDSLLDSPRPMNWDIIDDEPMGPQIPGIPLEDIEMSAVDLGDESPRVRAEPPSIPPVRSPSPAIALQPPQRVRREPPTSSLPSSSAKSNPRPARRSPSRRSDRKHGRQRSRTLSPPRRRGDSYCPSAPYHNRRDDRRPYNQPDHSQSNSFSSSSPWSAAPSLNPWSSTTVPNPWSSPNTHQPGGPSVPWGTSPGYMP